ncbi:MAG: fumarylpyruvate hydrolase [Halocynthiibacter sp.]|jgi:fumarylpyruvate hydrolase
MTKPIFDVPSHPLIPIVDDERGYPVRRIFCVGRNYAAHAAEMGMEVDRSTPFYFTKSPAAIALSGSKIAYPGGTGNYHYEMELVIAMGSEIYKTDTNTAKKAIFGYGCGLDMTRRDLQMSERAQQRPWDLGKDVEQSAVLGAITPVGDFGDVADQAIRLRQNGEMRQDAVLSDMIYSPVEILVHLSGFYHLGPGDLIYTGTPAGVGAVEIGDTLEGEIEGLAPISVQVVA